MDSGNVGKTRQYQAIDKTIICMRILFNAVYAGRANIDFLYRKGMELKGRLEAQAGDLEKMSDSNSLMEAFEFIDGLHDSGARSYHGKSREQIYHHLIKLKELPI